MVLLKDGNPTRKTQLRKAAGQRGTPRRMLPGSWISDLAALGKAIVLCENCARKWSPAGAGYEVRQAIPGYNHVHGDCDSCGQPCKGTLYLPERGN